MANKIDTLKAEIAEMEEVANDPSTPEDVKKALAPAIKNAKAQLSALTPSSSAPSAKPSSKAPAAPKPAAVPKPEVKKSDSGSKPSSLKDCQDLLEKYKDKKQSDKKRVQKRADQGKPPVLTPSEVVKKTATSVKAKVIEIKKADKKLPASEITKITNGIVSTIKGTLSGMTSAVTKKAFLSDIINELRKLERNLPIAAMHGAILAAGGRTTSAINRDRMFQSQEEWEKNYNRRGQPGRRYMEAGGTSENGIDLFEDYNNIPSQVQEILDKYKDDFEDQDYRGLEKAKKELEGIGYTFEYYLDGVAYDLRPIGTKGASEGIYQSGGYMAAGGENKDDVWTFGQGTIKLNGKEVYSYEFDRDSDAFWVDDSYKSGGQRHFETGEGLLRWFKKKYYSGQVPSGFMAAGGETMNEENADLLQSQIKSIKHHSDELSSIVGDTPIEPWVLARATRAASDLSDITHYLDGVVKKKYKRGGVTASQANLFESGGNNQEYFSADEVKNHLEQDGYNIHNDTQLRAIASIEGYKFDKANNRWYYSQKQHTVHEYAKGGSFNPFKYEYQLELESRINPDFSSSESGNVVIKPKKYWVKNIDQAKKMALDFIKENSLGGGNYVPANIYQNGKKIATVSYNGKVWDEETGNERSELVEKSAESERIAKMVKGWNEEGRAFSYLSKMDQDDEFFEKIGVSPDKMGITSQTGNDIVYYDTSRYESDNNALRKIKKLAIGGIIEHGINKGDLIVDVYKDYGIIAEGGDKNVIVAWDPNVGSRYYAGIDETKPVGSRDMGLTYEEKIKDAKKYIDFLDNEIKVKAGLRRAEKGMQLSGGHNYPKVQMKGYDNHGTFWYVVGEDGDLYKLVAEEKIDLYEKSKGTPDEMYYLETDDKASFEPVNGFAKGGGIDEEKMPVPANFTVEGLDGSYPGYSFGDLWNGWQVPYFRLDTAKKIAKDSFQGDNETHLVYDSNKNVFIYHEKEADGEFIVTEIEPFVFRLDSLVTLDLFPIGAYNWAWDKKAKSEPVKSVNKPLETITYKGEEITHSEHMPEFWFVGDEEFKSLAAAKKHIDGGSKPSARTVNAYRHGAMKKGGEVSKEGNIITKSKFDKLYPESKFDIQIKRFFVKAEGYEVPTHDLVKYYIVAEKGNDSKPIIYKQVSDKKVELVDKLPEPSKK